MRIVRQLNAGKPSLRNPVVALGSFDGVHVGHREILGRTLAIARELVVDAAAFTFYPHPIAVLAPERAPKLLLSLARRLAILRSQGLDGVVLQRFTKSFSMVEPESFVQDVLCRGLGVSAVVVGYNVTFGRNRRGTPELLSGMGRRHGFRVEIVDPVHIGDTAVSSSLVRATVAKGDVELAGRLLARAHAVVGRVRVGDRRGATIGFPTANIFPRGGMLPPDGVYAVRVGIEGEPASRPGVANLGHNPTFGIDRRRLETHLFDFSGDLYGRRIEVAFQHRLRGEQRFASVADLVQQIQRDAQEARGRLG